MLDMSWGELLVIGAVALVVIGPKDLPKALRTVGNVVGKVRRMAGEFQTQFNDAMREADLEELRKSASDISDAIKPFKSEFDPLKAARDEIKNAVQAPVSVPAETSATAPPRVEVPAPNISKPRRVAKKEQAGAAASKSADGRPRKATNAVVAEVSASEQPEQPAHDTPPAKKKPVKFAPRKKEPQEAAAPKSAPGKPTVKRSAAAKTASRPDEKTS